MSEKDERTYRRILSDANINADEFLMVGNSIRSDILPVVALGARAVHVSADYGPYGSVSCYFA